MTSATAARHCRICGNERLTFYVQFQGIAYVRCSKCGVVMIAKEASAEELASYYDADYFEKDYKKSTAFSYFSEHEKAVASCAPRVAVLNEYVDLHGAVILDVGCAAGYFLEAVKRDEPSATVEGVEISEDAAKIASEAFHIPIIAEDLLAIQGERRYDAITMFQTLEHLNDPIAYLRKCHALLKEGGLLFVEVPNLRTIDRLFDPEILERIFSVPYHLFMFDPSSLSFALEKSGFSIVKERVYLSARIGRLITSILGVFRTNVRNNISGGRTGHSAKTSASSRTYSRVRDMLARIAPGSNMLMIARKEESKGSH